MDHQAVRQLAIAQADQMIDPAPVIPDRQADPVILAVFQFRGIIHNRDRRQFHIVRFSRSALDHLDADPGIVYLQHP